MKRSSTLYLRNVLLVFSALTLCFVFVFYEDAGIPLVVRDRIRASPQKFLVGNPAHNEKMGFDRLDLSEGECRETFPDLFADIEYAVKGRKTVLGKDNGNYKGLVQGRIKNNQVRRSFRSNCHVESSINNVILKALHHHHCTGHSRPDH